MVHRAGAATSSASIRVRRYLACSAAILCGLAVASGVLSAGPESESEVVVLHDAATPRHLTGAWRYTVGDRPEFARPDLDDDAWMSMQVPGNVPWPRHDAMVWLRLHVRIPDSETRSTLALRLGSIKFAYELFFNGHALGGVGTVGERLQDVQPAIHPEFFTLPDDAVRWGGDNVVAIRLASVYGGGGLEGTDWWIGPRTSLFRGWLGALITSGGLACLYLFIAIYHLFLYVRRREETAYLYYGLLVLSAGVYVLATRDVLSLFVPPYALKLRIEVATLLLMGVAGARFLRHFFERQPGWLETQLERLYASLAAGTAFLVLVALSVPAVFKVVNGLVCANLFVVFPYLFFHVIWAFRRRLPGSSLLAIAVAFFFVMALNDSIIAIAASHPAPRLFQLGFLAVVLAMALMLAEKFVAAHRTAASLNVTLEEQVQTRTRDLAVANTSLDAQNRELASLVKELEDQDQLKKDMLAMITHELRGPLTRVVVWSDMMTRDRQASEATREEAFVAIRKAALEMDAYVEDMLEVSRLEQAAIRPELFEVALRPLVERALERQQVAFEQHSLRLAVAAPPDLPPVRTDPRLLRDVLDNLISNAVKYTPDGGSIEVRAKADGRVWTLEVADTGIGIPPEDQAKVFDKFFIGRRQKLPRAVHRSGVGLYTVAMYVGALGGQIRLQSEPGVGTTFTLEFPCGTLGVTPGVTS